MVAATPGLSFFSFFRFLSFAHHADSEYSFVGSTVRSFGAMVCGQSPTHTHTHTQNCTLYWRKELDRAKQSRVRALEISYLRGPCGVTRWEGESNESVSERCSMGACANGVKCGVVEWVKRNTLRWFGYIERMKSEELMKKNVCERNRGS